jgi:hypothetical protein
MGERAIDVRWRDWRVDQQVEGVLEGIAEDAEFIELV